MKISSINYILRQLYPHDEVNIDNVSMNKLELEGNMSSTIVDTKNTNINIIDGKTIDIKNNAPIIATALNIESTEQNLAYIQRLGFSMVVNLKRLIELINKDNKTLIYEKLDKILPSPTQIQNSLEKLSDEDILNIADIADTLMAIIRYYDGEYVDIHTRLSLDIGSDEYTKQHLEHIVEILVELNMEITPENIELVDKFIFVFEDNTSHILNLLKTLQQNKSTIDIENIMDQPEIFLKFNEVIHNNEHIIDNSTAQDIYEKADEFIGYVNRYIKLFPIESRKNIFIFFKNALLDPSNSDQVLPGLDATSKEKILEFFKTEMDFIRQSNIKAVLYNRIEEDISYALSLQLKDNFPFWLIPIFTIYNDKFLLGELWVKKRTSKNEEKASPYNLFVWWEFPNLGHIEIGINGIAKNINMYMLSPANSIDIIRKYKDQMTDILKVHGFIVGDFELLELKDNESILIHTLANSINTHKNLDIKI